MSSSMGLVGGGRRLAFPRSSLGVATLTYNIARPDTCSLRLRNPRSNSLTTATRSLSSGSSKIAHPPWLASVLQDSKPAPKLFKWTPSNLGGQTGPSFPAAASQTSPSASDLDRRIYVLGVGNLGILFATALAKLDDRPPITLVVHRRGLLETWASNPALEISRNGTTDKISDFDIEWWTEEAPETGPRRYVTDGSVIRNLLVSTKASAALPEVDRLRRYLDGTSTVAFAQNGMSKLWPPYGNAYNKFRYPGLDHPNWMACVTTHGVTSMGRFKCNFASEGGLNIGSVLLNPNNSSGELDYMSSLLAIAPKLHGKQVSTADLWVLQLEKLVVNAIINPLTAVLRCKNGKLFEGGQDGPLMKLIDTLLEEASAVLQRLIREPTTDSILEGTSGVGATTNRDTLLERFSQPRLTEMLLQVGRRAGENTSSMLQDVRAGKQTEIRDFNGWLADTAALLGGGLAVPNHEILIRLVENGTTVDDDTIQECFPGVFSEGRK